MSRVAGLVGPDRLENPEAAVRQVLQAALSYEDVWARLLDRIHILYGDRATKVVGDFWEAFCVLYLRATDQYLHVWPWSSVPAEVRAHLGIAGRDKGIDLICQLNNKQFIAVQCKYRRRQEQAFRTVTLPGRAVTNMATGMGSLAPSRTIHPRTNQLQWKEVATFDALCARTGPWAETLIMTTCTGVSRPPRKTTSATATTAQEVDFVHAEFRTIPRATWLRMSGFAGHSLSSSSSASSSSPNTPAQALPSTLNTSFSAAAAAAATSSLIPVPTPSTTTTIIPPMISKKRCFTEPAAATLVTNSQTPLTPEQVRELRQKRFTHTSSHVVGAAASAAAGAAASCTAMKQ